MVWLETSLLFVHLMDFLAYPRWMELLHDIVIFVEASIPFVVSFLSELHFLYMCLMDSTQYNECE